MKKYVTINNKENTANILLLNIFLYTKSDFTVFDFTIKSLPIIVFYFRWRMLEDSLTFKLSSPAPSKGENWELRSTKKKDRSAKCQSMTLLALIFISSMYVIKIVKKNSKIKIAVPFIYFLISSLIFHFHQLLFKNKILSRIANIYDGYWNKLTKKLFKK